MIFFFPIPKSVKTRLSQGIKKDTRFSLVSLFLIAETGFEPALPTSKSGRPLSLSAFCLRNSRFLACITFLLLPPAAVGAAAPGTRRSQSTKKDTRFFSCIPFSLAETGFEPALPTSKSGRPLSLSAFCLRNSRFLACSTFLLLPPAAVGAAAPGTRRSQSIKKRYKIFSCIPFSLAETGFEPATSGL